MKLNQKDKILLYLPGENTAFQLELAKIAAAKNNAKQLKQSLNLSEKQESPKICDPKSDALHS